jgi:hypothetical protein
VAWQFLCRAQAEPDKEQRGCGHCHHQHQCSLRELRTDKRHRENGKSEKNAAKTMADIGSKLLAVESYRKRTISVMNGGLK